MVSRKDASSQLSARTAHFSKYHQDPMMEVYHLHSCWSKKACDVFIILRCKIAWLVAATLVRKWCWVFLWSRSCSTEVVQRYSWTARGGRWMHITPDFITTDYFRWIHGYQLSNCTGIDTLRYRILHRLFTRYSAAFALARERPSQKLFASFITLRQISW